MIGAVHSLDKVIEKFEVTNGVSRSRKSKKQTTGKGQKDIVRQNTAQKTEDWETDTPTETGERASRSVPVQFICIFNMLQRLKSERVQISEYMSLHQLSYLNVYIN